MAKEKLKQHVPIFVGSTFVDLKIYRGAVREALHRLETIVRGMEYFGSKPGAPVDECLSVVRTCKVYIGIFGMRYGSIPDDYDKSMTHLEYEEAQRSALPSLIYIIDEEKQPILPKYVETGIGAERLKDLKDLLHKTHLVSHFTTEEDLSSKILHDIPPVLEKLGTIVDGSISTENTEESILILKRFEILPRRWRGKEVVIEITIDGPFKSLHSESANALNLQIGGSVWTKASLPEMDEEKWSIYGEDDIAEQLIDLPNKIGIKARVITIFGVDTDVHVVEGGKVSRPRKAMGLLIKEILEKKEE